MSKFVLGVFFRTLARPLGLTAVLICVLASCESREGDPKAGDEENPEPNPSARPELEEREQDIRSVFLKRLQERVPLTPAERARFATFILEDPAGAWQLIEGIEDDDEKRGQGVLFFRALAEHDPELAAQFLPSDSSMHEKVDWHSEICVAAVGVGNLELAQKLLNKHFKGGGRGLAMGQIFPQLFIAETEVSTIVQFWESVRPGSEKDAGALSFAQGLATADPEAALEWYLGIERREEKRYAMRGISAGYPAGIAKQIQLSDADPKLQSYLAGDLGSKLGMKQGDIGTFLSQVPEGLVDTVELAYVQALGSRMGSGPDLKLVEDYAKVAVTQGAKDRAAFMLASSEFVDDPKVALEQVRDDELLARNPDEWASMLSRWLRVDSIRASEYIAGLEGDAVYVQSVETMVKYLKRAGQDDEAKGWEDHLRERAQEP